MDTSLTQETIVHFYGLFYPASDWGDRAGLNKSHQLGRLSLEDIPRLKISCIIMRVRIHMLRCEKWVMVRTLDVRQLASGVGDYIPK
jgi:hypothetical protein